jgi:hypothetical protein
VRHFISGLIQAALLSAMLLLAPTGADAQSAAQWSYGFVGNNAQATYPGTVAVPQLGAQNCLGTDANGVFGAGTCGSTASITAGTGLTSSGNCNPLTACTVSLSIPVSPANGGTNVVHALTYASGSAQTTTGTISAASNNLTLAAAIDFSNGQGIRVDHAGAAFAASPPTSATVTPTGTTGATSYAYTVASIDANGGVGAAIANFTTATGNATLSLTNYNALSWTAGAGAASYAVYGRVSGSLTLLAITAGTTFNDYGSGTWPYNGPPSWLPTTPQGSALADWLVTTVASGGGTTSLVLSGTATTAATSKAVLHDDTASLQTAINAASAASVPLFLDCGSYYVTSEMTASNANGFGMSGCNQQDAKIISQSPTQNVLVMTSSSNFNIFEDFSINCLGGGIFATAGKALDFTAVETGNQFSRILTQACGFAISGPLAGPNINNSYFSGSQALISITSPGDSTIQGNTLAPYSIPGYPAAEGIQLIGDPGGMRIINNKFNAGGGGYIYGIFVRVDISDGDFLVTGNSIEGVYSAGIYFDRSASAVFGNVVITGNQIGTGGDNYDIEFFPSTNGVYSSISITGNKLYAINDNIIMGGAKAFNISGNELGAAAIGINIAAAATQCGIGFNTFDTTVTTQITDSSAACTYAQVTSTKPTYP